MDLHLDWIRTRPRQTAAIVDLCDFISGTEEELIALGAESIERARQRGAVILIKMGAQGVTLTQYTRRYDLPPPCVPVTLNEIGAGDLLFGALASVPSLLTTPGERLQKFKEAYLAASPLIEKLLRSDGPEELYILISDLSE
ncbi:hypothetical protein MBTS_09950 [Methylobacterium bullatum]|nr:hypothetical protein [Methylobacterium bullatum]